jgi:hypothetical protein
MIGHGDRRAPTRNSCNIAVRLCCNAAHVASCIVPAAACSTLLRMLHGCVIAWCIVVLQRAFRPKPPRQRSRYHSPLVLGEYSEDRRLVSTVSTSGHLLRKLEHGVRLVGADVEDLAAHGSRRAAGTGTAGPHCTALHGPTCDATSLCVFWKHGDFAITGATSSMYLPRDTHEGVSAQGHARRSVHATLSTSHAPNILRAPSPVALPRGTLHRLATWHVAFTGHVACCICWRTCYLLATWHVACAGQVAHVREGARLRPVTENRQRLIVEDLQCVGKGPTVATPVQRCTCNGWLLALGLGVPQHGMNAHVGTHRHTHARTHLVHEYADDVAVLVHHVLVCAVPAAGQRACRAPTWRPALLQLRHSAALHRPVAALHRAVLCCAVLSWQRVCIF